MSTSDNAIVWRRMEESPTIHSRFLQQLPHSELDLGPLHDGKRGILSILHIVW